MGQLNLSQPRGDLNSGLHLVQVLAGGHLLSGVDPRREGLAGGD